MADQQEKKKHFILDRFTETERYTPPRQIIQPNRIPGQDRHSHGRSLLGQIETLKGEFRTARQAQEDAGFEGGFGLQVEFESFPDIELAFESLARERSGIELLNIRHEENRSYATVFVPDGKLALFESLIRDYLEDRRDSRGRSRDHKALIDTIHQIHAATLKALWTDDRAVFPESDDEVFWWEVWLPVRDDRMAVLNTFRRRAEEQGFQVVPGELQFPERTIVLVRASAREMSRSMMTLNSIAELRRAKETADFFDSLRPEDQPDWVDELVDRCRFPGPEDQVPYVCLLDTGVNNAHPLISPVLEDDDLHTVEPAWGTHDEQGHGTAMAGLALAGDLTNCLDSNEPVEILHRLESVKLLQDDGGNGGDARHHGYLTIEAVSRPEITDPDRRRVFGMAITARDNRDRGRPSAWSAAVDRLAADVDGEGEIPRLFILSAGNILDQNAWKLSPVSNSTDGIHDPAQSWNALTIGAFTNLTRITETDAVGYQPVAPEGGLSPFSTTSFTWQSNWPLKPDVMFEGGNAANDGLGAVTMPSLSLLTSHHKFEERLLTTANATSAASALAARMAAQLMAEYPDLWPETVRGLIVHSAEWTDAMRQAFLPRTNPSKGDFLRLVRHCGFGVPDLDRALWSISNSLTMVLQDQLHPFQRVEGKQPTIRDMNLHRLPWPLEELESLGEAQVEMRVTLSYFIEPNPSERGFRSRYRYESHGLRFEVKRAQESETDFRTRINAAARDEEEGTVSRGNDPDWDIGKNNRHKGSLHSDIWRGSAVDLASRGVLAVYPALGWWKTRIRHERYNMPARYVLIVSIHAPEIDVDLYTAIANKIAVPITVET